MKIKNLFVFILCFSLFAGCSAIGSKRSTGKYPYEGTIQYVNLEGGFYGIVTDEGKKYDPLNLPREFWRDGLRVAFDHGGCSKCASFRMWGEIVDIVNIQEIEKGVFLNESS